MSELEELKPALIRTEKRLMEFLEGLEFAAVGEDAIKELINIISPGEALEIVCVSDGENKVQTFSLRGVTEHIDKEKMEARLLNGDRLKFVGPGWQYIAKQFDDCYGHRVVCVLVRSML